jgi:hypothetical protein
LYDCKTPITAVEILNDRVVPFYDEHGATLGYRWAWLLANLPSRTDDRVAKSRARGESPAAPLYYCRSSFAAPVRAFGPLAFQPATKRA